MKWSHEDKPSKKGIYATLVIWDPIEGIFDDVNVWDGEKWESDRPITSFCGPFDDKETAEQWGEDNNPDNR